MAKTAPLDLEKLQESATSAYRRTVEQCARDKAVDEENLRQVLVLAGKSLESFRNDVSRLTMRLGAFAELERPREGLELEAARKEHAQAADALNRLTLEFKEREKAAIEAFRSTQNKASALEDEEVIRRSEAGRQAEETLDPKLKARIHAMKQEVGLLSAMERHWRLNKQLPAPRDVNRVAYLKAEQAKLCALAGDAIGGFWDPLEPEPSASFQGPSAGMGGTSYATVPGDSKSSRVLPPLD